ncbi:MAG: hypothetical protein PHF44_01825 [Candidatus Pacebacteria bacterium]|nr:hypothetical protein [Candidatus Paceibacterota bacterium]
MQKTIANEELNISIKGKILEIAFAVIFILIGVSFRLLPHLPNFAPIAALALFAGVYLSKKIAIILPLAAMVISDIFIGSYEPKLMAAVYGSFILCVFLGFWLKEHKKWQTVLGSSVLGALIFFLLTNFSVWAFTPWYAKSIPGLIQCYYMGLPFFRNTLLGDLFYAAVFFGSYELIQVWIAKKFKAISAITV